MCTDTKQGLMKGEKIMIQAYAYLCNLKRCTNCTFPTCSHTTDSRYRMPTEGTEMRLLGCSNGVEYYMEFFKKNEDTIDIGFNSRDKESNNAG